MSIRQTKQTIAGIAVLMFLYPMHAFAYVDPSVMSYTIQAVAGILIVSGVVFSVAWRRIRNKALKAMNIDENAGKEVEPDIIVTDLEEEEK